MFDRNGKQGAEYHVSRGVAGFLFDLDDLSIHASETGRSRFGCGPHRRKRDAQAAAFKRRINDPALSLPCLTIGQEHGIAQQGAQPFADPVGLGKVIGPRFEHFFDQFRLVCQVAAEKTECEIQPSTRDTIVRVGLTGCLGETIAYSAKGTLCSGDFGVWAVGSLRCHRCIFGHSIIDA